MVHDTHCLCLEENILYEYIFKREGGQSSWFQTKWCLYNAIFSLTFCINDRTRFKLDLPFVHYLSLHLLRMFRAAIFLCASDAEAMVESVVWVPKLFGPEHPLIFFGIKHFVHKVLAVTRWRVVILEQLFSFAFSFLDIGLFVVLEIFCTF